MMLMMLIFYYYNNNLKIPIILIFIIKLKQINYFGYTLNPYFLGLFVTPPKKGGYNPPVGGIITPRWRGYRQPPTKGEGFNVYPK